MDPAVKKFLEDNQLGHYAAKFEEEEVIYEDLSKFSPVKAKELIPKTGPRIRFLEAVSKLKRRCLEDNAASTSTDGVRILDQTNDSFSTAETENEVETNESNENSSKLETDKSAAEIIGVSANLGTSGQRSEILESKTKEPEVVLNVQPEESTPEASKKRKVEVAVESAAQPSVVVTVDPPLLSSLVTGLIPPCLKEFNLDLATDKEKEELRDFLENLLKSSVEGTYVLNALLKEQANDKVRDSLCRILLSFGVNNSIAKGQISPSRFKYLALSVKALFPTESPLTYYVPQAGKKSPKGKLYWKYTTQRSKFRNAGLVESRTRAEPAAENANLIRTPDWSKDYTPDATILQDVELVKKNPTTYAVLKPTWVSTTFARLQPLHLRTGKLLQIDEYLNKYPALRKQYALDLIFLDFEELYPGKQNLLLHLWPTLEDKIIDLAARKLKTESHFRAFVEKEVPGLDIIDTLNPDDKSLLALRLLSSLISPKPGSRKAKKFTRKDILDDFIVFIPSGNDKSVELNRRIDRLKELGHASQPVPVIVGSEAETRQYTAEINNFIFNVSSAVEAVDSCFKLIMVLNASYSPTSELVWLFLQLHVFKIKTDFDSPVPTLEALAPDLGLV